MAAGEAWLFDSWRRHRVINGGSADRVHLVIDIAGSANFWRMVRGVQRASVPASPELITCDQHNSLQLKTERFPSAPVMAPGEMSAIVTELLADCSANPDNDPRLLEFYHDLLFDLVHDWRNHWSLHGFMVQGVEGYQALLDRARMALKSDPRVLVTESNKVGINPIINQRLLAAALRPRRASEFVTGSN